MKATSVTISAVYLIGVYEPWPRRYGHEPAAATLQSPQLPPAQVILTPLINEIVAVPDPFILVLDDFHEVESPG